MKAAFGDKQFKEMMTEWGLTTSKEDIEKIASLGGGAYCLKEDKHLFTEFAERVPSRTMRSSIQMTRT